MNRPDKYRLYLLLTIYDSRSNVARPTFWVHRIPSLVQRNPHFGTLKLPVWYSKFRVEKSVPKIVQSSRQVSNRKGGPEAASRFNYQADQSINQLLRLEPLLPHGYVVKHHTVWFFRGVIEDNIEFLHSLM